MTFNQTSIETQEDGHIVLDIKLNGSYQGG